MTHANSLIWLLLLTPLSGCGSAAGGPNHFDPASIAAKAIDAYDTNNDRQLSDAELNRSPALAASLKRLDPNRDGVVTAEEIESRIRALDAQSDYIGMSVQVNSKGRPLVGALLTLVPEPAMGEELQSFSGTTLEGGGCPLRGESNETPGLPVGFYQANIVHEGAGINEVRGCEIADDVTGNRLSFDL